MASRPAHEAVSAPPPLLMSQSFSSSHHAVPPPNTTRSPRHMRSPNSHRRVKADGGEFPRSQLWTWSSPSAVPSATTRERVDAVDSILRDAGNFVPAALPSSASPGPIERRAASPLASHLSHGAQQPPASAGGSSGALNSMASSQPQLLTGPSRRRLAKRETHSSLRGSGRNLTAAVNVATPTSKGITPTIIGSSPSNREADGWKAYKVAHRTNRLIAKTRRVLEVLHRSGSSGRKPKSREAGDVDQYAESDDRFGSVGEKTDGDGHEEEDLEPEEVDEDAKIQEEERRHRNMMRQLFERDVCDEDEVEVIQDKKPQPNTEEDFWKIYKSVSTTKRPGSPRGRYIGKCEEKSLLVLPVLDLKRPTRYNPRTKMLRYDNYYFGNDRAEAFGEALHILPVPVSHLSMENVGITSPGSSAIVNGIALRQLQHLNFADNKIGPKGASTIVKGLRDTQLNLKTLNLSNNQLGDQTVISLMQCLVNRCTLEQLNLRKNNIFHAAKAVGELLRISTPLKSLDLSWNNIRGEPAQYLAKCMMENITLTSLDLSDNTLGNNGNADAELGACLATNKSLKSLDVSNNHIHGKSILVYVNGLQHNSTLETLAIRGNPIGNLGAEAILRCVASEAIAKCEIDIGECNVEIQDASQQTVIYGGGVYNLNLAERADAILLRELLALNWKGKAEVSDAIWNGSPYTFNRKDEKTFLNTFPSSGLMQLKIQPNYDRHEEMISPSGLMRIERMLRRSFGSGRDGDEAAKLFCIRLLTEEYSFTVDNANTLLALFQTHTSQVEKASAAAVLIPQICGAKATTSCSRDDVYDCASMEIPDEFFEDKDKDGKIDVCGDICMVIGLKSLSDVEQAHVEKRVGKWISFNVNNPTGRYRLNMANQIDRRILMRILETNRTEKKIRQHFKLMDTSQHGLAQQPLQGGFRNVRLNHVPVIMGSGWQFPRVGIFEFDFVQTKRPYSICTALSDAAFEKFLREFKQLDVDAETKLIGLRSISTSYYFNCSQVQRLMEHFGTFERDTETGILFRAEVFVILFSRIVDEWNFSETLTLLDLATKQQVFDRLGLLHCFHPLQVAESYGSLQLSVFDNRQLILILVKLAVSGEIELASVVMNNDTVVAPDEWKVWTSDDKIPAAGLLSCAMRAPNGMQTEAQLAPTSVRKKLLQTLLLKLENRAQETIS